MRDWIARALIASGLLAPAGGQAATLADFAGQWRGTEARAEGGQTAPAPKDLELAITPTGDGFRARWAALQRDRAKNRLERREVEAGFTETDRPGVYAFSDPKGSLFGRLFASPATGNPLEGETLLWARLDGDTLSLYSLGLNTDGGFDLHHYAYTLADGAIDLMHTYRTEDPPPLQIEARLAREGD